jgi:hypothetical protein
MSFKTLLCLFVFVLSALRARANDDVDLAHVADLAFGVRVHRPDIVMGDPVYIELDIVNRGKDIVRAPPFGLSNLEFRAFDPESGLETECLVALPLRSHWNLPLQIASRKPRVRTQRHPGNCTWR